MSASHNPSDADESDAVTKIPSNQETPLPETLETLISAENQEEEEETSQDDEEESSDQNSPISPRMPPSVTGSRNSSRRGGRKKKGKPNYKKVQVFEKKYQSLMKTLNPIPFIPPTYSDLAPYESLFRKFGLWDFIHISFDTNLRKDLIAQLVASYESRSCYINDKRYPVTRADFARAFKIPLFKKEKKSVDVVEDHGETISEAMIVILSDFVSNWMLLHEDMWMMPEEVMNWIKVIKEGHPEKVDWAGMLWYMVERELSKGENLGNCYYASHLQHFMKEQKVFLREEAEGSRCIELIEVGNEGDEHDVDDDTNDELLNDVEEDASLEVPDRLEDVSGEVDENISDDATAVPGEDMKVDDAVVFQGEEMKLGDAVLFDGEMKNGEMGGLSVELTLGQDSEKEEGVKNVDVMDFENHEESDGEGENEQVQWLMNGKNDMGDHFMQHCSSGKGRGLEETEDDSKVEEENEEFEDEEDDEMGDKFPVFPTDALEGDGFTGNYLQSMEGNQMSFGSHGHIHMQQMESGPSFLNETGKRGIEYENGIFNHSLGDNNKRLRINAPSEPKPVDFGTCMENAQHMMEKAKMFYTEKEQALEQASMSQEILLREVQKRDEVINMLQKNIHEENEKHNYEKIRYERELELMGSLLKGYRKAMKDTQRAFDEYRQRAQLPEEPVYKHVGGGLMLSTGEIERIRKKQEEEYRVNCLIVAQRAKEAETCFMGQMDACNGKIHAFGEKLAGLETDVKELAGLFAKRKDLHTEVAVCKLVEPAAANEESMPDVIECPANEEIVTETAEPQANKEMELDVKELSANVDKESDVALLPADLPDQDKGSDVTELAADEDKEVDGADLPADEAKEMDEAELPANEVKEQDVAALPVDEVKDPEVAEASANESMLVD